MSEIATGGTIAAIATVVPQQGSVGIVRVSGAEAMLIAQSLPGRQPWKLTGYSMVTLWSLRRSNWWMKRYC